MNKKHKRRALVILADSFEYNQAEFRKPLDSTNKMLSPKALAGRANIFADELAKARSTIQAKITKDSSIYCEVLSSLERTLRTVLGSGDDRTALRAIGIIGLHALAVIASKVDPERAQQLTWPAYFQLSQYPQLDKEDRSVMAALQHLLLFNPDAVSKKNWKSNIAHPWFSRAKHFFSAEPLEANTEGMVA